MTPQNIVLLTDENYECNYVGVRVLVSHGNVFLFLFSLLYEWHFSEVLRSIYASLYLVFHMPRLRCRFNKQHFIPSSEPEVNKSVKPFHFTQHIDPTH